MKFVAIGKGWLECLAIQIRKNTISGRGSVSDPQMVWYRVQENLNLQNNARFSLFGQFCTWDMCLTLIGVSEVAHEVKGQFWFQEQHDTAGPLISKQCQIRCLRPILHSGHVLHTNSCIRIGILGRGTDSISKE